MIRKLSMILMMMVLFGSEVMVVSAETDSYTDGTYTLVMNNEDPSFDSTVKQRMIDTFFIVYPQMVARFNGQAVRKVNFTIDPTYSGVAEAGGGNVRFSSNWLRKNPEDIDTVTHELMHIVQAYPGGSPGWMTEGIADYARYKYGRNNGPARWSLPNYSPDQKYTDSYQVTARFFVWLENRIRPSIVNEMDFNLRNRTYSEQLWVNVTGQTVDQLWQQYSKDPNLTSNDVLVGRPYKLINVNSGKALDVQGSGASNGTNVQIYSDNGSAAQRWTVYRNQDGTYKLINAISAKALDVQSSGTAEGTNVQIWDDNGSGAQKWSFIRNTDGSYKLINSNSNKVLDVSSSGTNDGTNVQIWTDNGTAAQKWKLVLLN